MKFCTVTSTIWLSLIAILHVPADSIAQYRTPRAPAPYQPAARSPASSQPARGVPRVLPSRSVTGASSPRPAVITTPAAPAPADIRIRFVGRPRLQIGSAAVVGLEASNVGGSSADNLVVRVAVSGGRAAFHPAIGLSQWTVPRLAPGEARPLMLLVTPDRPGPLTLRVRAEGDRPVETEAVLPVVPRQLEVRLFGPPARVKGQHAEWTAELTNVSARPLEHVRLKLTHDRTLSVLRRTPGGNAADNTVVWPLETVQPGERVLVQVEFDCPIVSAESCVRLEGVAGEDVLEFQEKSLAVCEAPAGLIVEVRDLPDLQPVGEEWCVAISVTNGGFDTLRGVTLSCSLPNGVEFVRPAEGGDVPAGGWRLDGPSAPLTLVFGRDLEAGETTITGLVVRGKKASHGVVEATASAKTGSPPHRSAEPVTVIDPVGG